MVIQSSVE
ncbi:hypothetical protein A2U01_0097247, partial [Trifolium medium]|nr:hypothetical protein [Trifolium medium]